MKPTKIYAENVEATALEQFNETMAQPFVLQGALMADAHTGYTAPIGCVVAVKDNVYPCIVGYDIGCGVSATKLDIPKEVIESNIDTIYTEILKRIPVGFNKHPADLNMPQEYLMNLTPEATAIAEKKQWKKQLGTLGGGNHFIELGADEEDNVWIIIHSGSRGVGYGIAAHYIKQAHPEGKAKEGHFALSTDTDLGRNYITDVRWCQEFALDNRKAMSIQVIKVLEDISGLSFNTLEFINRNHNHVEYSAALAAWIHRKGATHAEKGMLGVIPGNMRDGTFIVEGLGNIEALWSSSHGAGRVLGRKAAKRELDVTTFTEAMQGIKANVSEATLDESPMAYKNIFEVMDLQKELVNVLHHVKPIINIKG